ncbi:MAG: tRNA epoxyqueuosine(34) reductase QueG, partial [Chloroflexota bacterium]
YVLDSRRCISYLTIELRGPIPRELRPLMRNRIFGCDICQEVCPWNLRFARPTADPAFQPRPGIPRLSLEAVLRMDEAAFRARFRRSAIRRAKWRGLVRNALIVAGNLRAEKVRPLLEAWRAHPDPMLR